MNWWRSLTLGAKLNLALLVFLVLLGAATLAIVVYGSNRTQESAQERSNRALEEQGKLALEALIGGVTEQGGLLFDTAGETGRRAAAYVETQASTTPLDTSDLARSDSGLYFDPDPARISDLVILNGASPDDPAVQADVALAAPLDNILPVLFEGFGGDVRGENFDPTAILFIGASGASRYYPPIGVHERIPARVDIAERLASIGQENNPDRGTIWTAPYDEAGGGGQIVTARTPVYVDDTLRGSLEVDLSIANLIDQVNQIKPTPGGFSFYVDKAGALMETETHGLIIDEAARNPDVSSILEGMRDNAPGDEIVVTEVEFAGEDFFIAYAPLLTLGGSFAVAAPVSDITANAATITAGIDDEANRTIWFMVAAMAGLFVVGLAGAAYLNRQAVVKPIGALVAATRSVAAGDLEARVPVSGRHDELGELGQSFNTMLEQLQESERVLERRVEERTRELAGLLEVTRVVSSTLELNPLLELVLEQTAVILSCDRSIVALREKDDLVIHAVRASEGDPGGTLARQVGMRFPLSSTPVLMGELESGNPLIIDDVHADEPLANAYREEVGGATGPSIAHFRSWMGIPFMVKGEFAGLLTVSLAQANAYSPSHAALGKAIASQVAIAVDNARLFAGEAQRSRELSMLLDVSMNAAASIELEPLLNLLLGELGGVLPHDRMAIQRYENGYLTVLAARDASSAGAKAQVRDGYQAKVDDDFFATRFPDRMPAIIDDILDEGDLAREFRASAHPHINSGFVPHGSYMAIPLTSRDHIVGLLTVMRDQPGFYTEDHARLGRAIGSQIAIAVDRAGLFEETRRSARETEALLRADAELFRSLELNTVLQALVDVAVDVLGVDKSIVVLHEGDIDVVRASRNYSLENLADFNRTLAGLPHVEPPPGQEMPREYEDASQAPGFIGDALKREGIASHISVPVRDRHRMLGVFGVSFLQRHTFSEDEKRLYSALADRAAVAIQNAERYERAQQAASLEERQRLARELHDSVSQALFGIALGARTARLRLDNSPATAAEPIEYVMSLAETGLAEMRALIFELRPESLESEGLVVALEKQAAATQARYSLPIELRLGDEPDASLAVKEAFYRITQEAIHNVVKHASASKATITLSAEGDEFVVAIEDNGRGFDANGAFPGHVGLVSMRERVTKLGGAVNIESATGKGTKVVAHLPRRAGPNRDHDRV